MGLYPEAAIWEYAEAQIPQGAMHLLSWVFLRVEIKEKAVGSEEIPSTVTASSIANLLTQLSHNSIKAKVGIGMKVNSGMEE